MSGCCCDPTTGGGADTDCCGELLPVFSGTAAAAGGTFAMALPTDDLVLTEFDLILDVRYGASRDHWSGRIIAFRSGAAAVLDLFMTDIAFLNGLLVMSAAGSGGADINLTITNNIVTDAAEVLCYVRKHLRPNP